MKPSRDLQRRECNYYTNTSNYISQYSYRIFQCMWRPSPVYLNNMVALLVMTVHTSHGHVCMGLQAVQFRLHVHGNCIYMWFVMPLEGVLSVIACFWDFNRNSLLYGCSL